VVAKLNFVMRVDLLLPREWALSREVAARGLRGWPRAAAYLVFESLTLFDAREKVTLVKTLVKTWHAIANR
jgi:hypothetical protein